MEKANDRKPSDPRRGGSATGNKNFHIDRLSSEPVDARVASEERILRRIPVETLSISAVLAVAVGLVFSSQAGLFVLAGGFFSAVSFLWLKRAIGRFLSPDKRRALRAGLSFYLLRLVLLIAVFSAIILLLPRTILAFVAGFSSVIPAFLMEALRALSQSRQWKS